MISKDFAVGIVLMYNKTGIGVGNGSGATDKEKRYNRTNELSVANGDSFDMKGWYISNGKVTNVPDLVGAYNSGKFVRGGTTSNASGGNDNTVLVQHNHGTNTGYGGIHNHGTSNASGTHRHNLGDLVRTDYSTDKGVFLGGFHDSNVRTGTDCESTRESYGDHSHTFASAGAHTHTTTSTGSDSRTNRNMPSYHKVIPIIRKN